MILAAAGAAAPVGRAFLRKRVVKIVALSAVLAFGVVAAELTVRLIVRPAESFGRFHRKPPGSRYTFRPTADVMPGVEGDAHYRTNAIGVRGEEVSPRADAYRILCVGGSTTICTYLDGPETWPALLMETLNRPEPKLPVWVGNAGTNGFSTFHHVRLLEERELLESMDCAVFLIGINDLSFQLKKRRRPIRDALPPLWRRSGMVEAVSMAIRRRTAANVEDVKGEIYLARRIERQNAEVVAKFPDAAESLDGYAEAIRRMVALCKDAGVRPVFVYQPVLWRRESSAEVEKLLWMGTVGGGKFLATAALRRGMDAYNARLEAVCKEQGAEFVTLASLDGRIEHFYDDCHFNEAGAREVARLLAAHFSARGWTRSK